MVIAAGLVALMLALLVGGLLLESAVRNTVIAPRPSDPAAADGDDNEWLSPEELARAFAAGRWGEAVLRLEPLGTVQLPTGRVVASDPFFVGDAHAFADPLPPGSHPVDLLLATFPDGASVTAARLAVEGARVATWRAAVIEGSASPAGEEPLGYAVDSGSGSFTSAESALYVGQRYDRFSDDLLAALQRAGPDAPWTRMALGAPGTPGAELDIAVFPSGYGDGAFGTWLGLDASGQAVAYVTDFGLLGPLDGPASSSSGGPDASPP
jgi:hypothetical protein